MSDRGLSLLAERGEVEQNCCYCNDHMKAFTTLSPVPSRQTEVGPGVFLSLSTYIITTEGNHELGGYH